MFGRSKDHTPAPSTRLKDIARRVRTDQERLRLHAESTGGAAWFEEPEMLLGTWPTFGEFRLRDRA